jgi:FAD/FMN-containing dehydrogenase
MRFFRDFTTSVPDEMLVVAAMLTAPDGTGKLVGVAAGHCGPAADGEAAVQPIKSFGSPVMDAMGPIPYVALNGMLDGAFPKGARNYWKSHFLSELSDAAIDAAVDRFAACPTPMGQMLFEHFHGAGPRVPAADTAYAMRGTGINTLVLAQWMDPAADAACIGWARDTSAAVRPLGGSRRYLNYLDEDDAGEAALAAAYGPNIGRLREVKRTYDPGNVFRHNQNIAPA